MQAAVLTSPKKISERPLTIAEVARPALAAGQVLLRVRACGVCRTDLHIVEGELPSLRPQIIPGHQIVGEIIEGSAGNDPISEARRGTANDVSKGATNDVRKGTASAVPKSAAPEVGRPSSTPVYDTPSIELPAGSRVGVSWLGGVDGHCPYCRRGLENLCDNPTFTGYTVDGGYAEFALARADFVFPLPTALDDVHAAPLLCAGIIGFRSIRVAGVIPGERVGLFGFGASAHLAIAVLNAWKCEVYVSTRGESHRKLAASLGAKWVGAEDEKLPVQLDRAITFAPSGAVVLAALGSLRKGGVVAINAIHLDQMPAFDYDKLLWGERQIRSVTNMTRADARDFLDTAAQIGLRPTATVFPLAQANEALLAVKSDAINGAAVLVP